MKIVLLGLLGLVIGTVAGAIAGVGIGAVWTSFAHTSCFEGECGMMVFFAFMPGGAVLGALVGSIGFGYVAARRRSGSG